MEEAARRNGSPNADLPGVVPVGLVEWFDVGEEERVERVVRSLRRLGAHRVNELLAIHRELETTTVAA